MISRFFIDRPIFASVLSIVITLAGGIALFNLPLAQYPQIAPPSVTVTCKYPGASARVVSETVAAPIEQQVNGVEGMLYMSSQCTNDGSYTLSVTFEHGMDLNMAQVLVQNRTALALPLLPEVIKQAGVTVRKMSPDILLSIALNSPDGSFDQLYLSNYALIRVKDELARLPGISDVNMLGQMDYSMRIWVDPDRLAARNLTAGDVVRALREQNQQVATGQIGQPPVPGGQPHQMTISTLGRLVEPEQFADIVIKTSDDRAVPAGGEPGSSPGTPAAPGGPDPLRATLSLAGTTGPAPPVPTPAGATTGITTSAAAPAAGTSVGMTSGRLTGSTVGMTNRGIAAGGPSGGATLPTTGPAPPGVPTTPPLPGPGTPGGGTAGGGATPGVAAPIGGTFRHTAVVRLRDVARVEMGAKNMDVSTKVNGRPSASIAVWTLPDANALETADIVKAKMADFPAQWDPKLGIHVT